MPERVAILAAMERELRPLVRHWQRVQVDGFPAWRWQNLLAVAGGIGPTPAQHAAETVVAAFRPALLVSAGFAGALSSHYKVAEILVPATVIDAHSGREYRTADPSSGVTLLTVDGIAGAASKQELARLYGAHAVDMEAAAVGQVAHRHGVEFRAVKAISEDAEFPLPSFAPFLTEHGTLRMAPLVTHLAARPNLWRSTWILARNAARAAGALARALRPLEGGGPMVEGLAQPFRRLG